jgi:hypothetical protein
MPNAAATSRRLSCRSFRRTATTDAVGVRREFRARRGLLRARAVGRAPFVWHIYPQADGAHRSSSPPSSRRTRPDWPRAGVERSGAVGSLESGSGGHRPPCRAGPAWERFIDEREALGAHARAWSETLQMQPELAAGLVLFG